MRLSIASPLGVLVSWDAVDTLDVSHYVVSGDLSGRTSGTSLAIPPYNITGAVHASVVAVDTLGLVSETPTQGSVTINGPARPAITSASLQTEGIAVSWRDAARTWPVARYIVTLGGVTVISQTATAIIPVPQSFAAGDAVTVQAVDIFNNAGEVSEAVEVAITPPKTPEIKLALNAGDGTVTVVWQDCATVCPIRHYVISGAMSGTSTGTSASLPAPKAAGGVTVQVVAVDVYGIESGTGQATLAVTAPENPVIKAEVRTDGLYLAWQDCAASWPVRHYVITDPWAGETYTSLVTSQAVPPRPAGTYLFGVRAVDTVGLASSTIYASVELGGVGRAAPSIRVDGADLVISWPRVASSFPIDRYEIVTVQGEQIGSAKTTYYRFPCPAAGTHGYRVRAVDAAGNLGEWGEASIAVDRPEPPQVTAALDGAGITVRWAATGHQLPIVAWDLVRQWEEARDDGVIETHEEDYGRLDVDCLTVPAVSTGVHYFMVRAVDSAGNVSGWGDCDFTVVAPGKVAFVNCATVDNNVMLYWTAPDTVFFPIREYVFSEIDGDGYEMEIGRIDAQFASSFETVSGEYVYGVTPVDAGGNRGALSTIKMAVSQPPDFVFYHNKDSLFNGVKANFVLDGRGSMIGPVPDETWTENVARAGLLAGRAVESWRDKNAAKYLTWLEPAFGLPLASYDGALWGRIYYQDVGADGMAIYKMLMMKPGVGRNIILHFGPGDWGDFTLHKFYSSGAIVIMTTLAGANATSAPADMPKFGTITVATGAVASLRNIEVDRVACSYSSRIHVQYYNTIGAVVSAYGGRLFFDSTSVTGIKAQSIQTSCFFYVYRHGLLDINGGAAFNILEAVSYSSAFLHVAEYSEVNIGATSFANAGRVTGKRFNLTNALLTDGNRNNHLLFPGTAAGVYGYGNIINGYATDLAIGGDTGDLTSKRGQIGDAVIVGTVDFNTLVKQGVYSPEANSTNGPNFTSQQILAVYQRNVSNKGRRVVQLAFNTSSPAAAIRTGLFTTGTEETPTSWSDWVRLITAATLGDGLQISSDGIVSVERRVEIPSGTQMLFQQTNAPTGWTKITVAEYNNAALRLVTGNVTNYTAGLAFSTAFATGRATTATAGGGSVGSTTLTTAQMPKHKHSVTHYIRRESGGDYKSYLYAGTGPNLGTMTCAEAGGSGAHTHSFSGISHSHALNLNVKYIDFIVAQKA